MKVMAVLGYPGRISGLLATDPIGESREEVHGRQRAYSGKHVADL